MRVPLRPNFSFLLPTYVKNQLSDELAVALRIVRRLLLAQRRASPGSLVVAVVVADLVELWVGLANVAHSGVGADVFVCVVFGGLKLDN